MASRHLRAGSHWKPVVSDLKSNEQGLKQGVKQGLKMNMI